MCALVLLSKLFMVVKLTIVGKVEIVLIVWENYKMHRKGALFALSKQY